MFGGVGPGIRLMRFKGVDVHLDISVLLLMALFIFPQAARFPRQFPEWSNLEVWGAAVLIGALFIGSILVHELSHAWIGMLLGARVSAIRLFIFGGATYFDYKPASEARNFWISIVGPLSNLALWGVFHFGLESSTPGTVWWVTCNYLSTVNFFLAAFNALPGYPMDGGQALRSAIIWLTKKEVLAATIVMVLGCLTGGLIAWWAIEALREQDTLGVIFRGLIAYWIISGSIGQYREAQRFQPVMPNTQAGKAPPPTLGIMAGAAMSRPPLALPPDMPVAVFLQQTEAMRLDDRLWLPVLREGYLQGIINRKLARKVPKTEQTSKTLDAAMLPRRNLLAVNAADDLSLAVEAVRASQGIPVAVLGEGGQFAGFISAENLRR